MPRFLFAPALAVVGGALLIAGFLAGNGDWPDGLTPIPAITAPTDPLPTMPPAAPDPIVVQSCADVSTSYPPGLLHAGLAHLADSLDAAVATPDQRIEIYIQAVRENPPGSYGFEARLLENVFPSRTLSPAPSVGPTPAPIEANFVDPADRAEKAKTLSDLMKKWLAERQAYVDWINKWNSELSNATEEFKTGVTDPIRALDPTPAPGSDWNGCISLASERLARAHPLTPRMYFVMIGDGVPYGQTDLGADRFDDVAVAIVNLYCPDGPAACLQRQAEMRAFFIERGATEVKFFDTNEPHLLFTERS